MTLKQKLDVGRHAAIGAKLLVARHLLISAEVEIQNAYPAKSKAYKLANKLLPAIDQLRNELDNCFAREIPHSFKPGAYFGPPKNALVNRAIKSFEHAIDGKGESE